jgi:hypothetical protein
MAKQKVLLVQAGAIKKHPCRAYGFLWSHPDYAFIAAQTGPGIIPYVVIAATPEHLALFEALERRQPGAARFNTKREPSTYGNWVKSQDFLRTDALLITRRDEPTAIYVAAPHMEKFGLKPDLKAYDVVNCADGQTFTKADKGAFGIGGIPAGDFTRAAAHRGSSPNLAIVVIGNESTIYSGEDVPAIRRLFEIAAKKGKKPGEILNEYEILSAPDLGPE